eukprot:TRINITY_DN22807_c0_g1_i1.p1 TRINITY_DN22807_c0_g1~~TRINITY_DN22807_c0_g1_i1.p1  ORF type:complete len:352 (+),score=56.71 TRINITY_DN22807_c0_g1_i1:49-1104(+)
MPTPMPSGLPPVHPGDDGQHTCWICLDHVAEASIPEDVLRPCPCAVYVHRSCLDEWRFSTLSSQTRDFCPTCKQPYEVDVLPGRRSTPSLGLVGTAVAVMLGIWIPPAVLLVVATSLLAPVLHAVDSWRNIPIALRWLNAHLRGLPEVAAHGDGYVGYLRERYTDHPEITWDQYALFAALLVCPAVLYCVHLTVQKEHALQRMELSSFRSDQHRGTAWQTGLLTWYYAWSHPYPPVPVQRTQPTRHRWRGGNIDSCDRACGDCNCHCDCPSDVKCEGDCGGALIALLIGFIVFLIVLNVISWLALMATTIAQTARLCSAYIRKYRDETAFGVGSLQVRHLGPERPGVFSML